MSKSVRKHRHPVVQKNTRKPIQFFKNDTQKRVAIYAVVVILAAIPFAMGKYMEFNTPDPFDSGGYVYSAQRVLDGTRIGVDDKPSAQMGTLLVNVLGVSLFGFNETGPKLIQMILQAAALVLMFITMRRLFGTLAAAVGVIVASVYLSAPLIAKFGNVKEQHMIAFMVLGVCCFVLYQLSGKWWCAVLSGAFLIFAPMFKETGVSALGGVGLFVLLQPVLKHSTWKKMGVDILLLSAGAILVVSPICLWLAVSGTPIDYYPYCFLYKPIVTAFEKPQAAVEPAPAKSETNDNKVQDAAGKEGFLMKLMPAYVRDSWRVMTPEQVSQAKRRVFRWYGVLILPVSLAAGAVIIRLIKLIAGKLAKSKGDAKTGYDRFVLLFAVWWLLDMSFVWISPRSYEQYYLPLNASAAMTGGYLIAVYTEKARNAASRPMWLAIGAIGLLLTIVMSWHVFFGVTRSPHSGRIYTNPDRQRGYAQALGTASKHRKGERLPWEVLSAYIKDNSTSSDKIYVWGWVPGIYVKAKRICPAPKAFEGTMHTLSPQELSERVAELLSSFEKEPPKFIVDTYKVHFPWDRPPLELWPNIWNAAQLLVNPPADREKLWYALLRAFNVQADDLTREGFLRPERIDGVRRYDAAYAKTLRNRISDPDEVKRFEAMKPFRDYVMNNYRFARTPDGQFLFQHK